MGPDGIEMLRTQGQGQSALVSAFKNPGQVRIVRRIQLGQRMLRARENAVSHAPFHVSKEARVPSTAPHNQAREKDSKEQLPAPGIPFPVVKGGAFAGAPVFEQATDFGLRMDPRQDALAEGGKV